MLISNKKYETTTKCLVKIYNIGLYMLASKQLEKADI